MKVKGYFDFDVEAVQNHYSNQLNYPFQQIFDSVERVREEVSLEMNK